MDQRFCFRFFFRIKFKHDNYQIIQYSILPAKMNDNLKKQQYNFQFRLFNNLCTKYVI